MATKSIWYQLFNEFQEHLSILLLIATPIYDDYCHDNDVTGIKIDVNNTGECATNSSGSAVPDKCLIPDELIRKTKVTYKHEIRVWWPKPGTLVAFVEHIQ